MNTFAKCVCAAFLGAVAVTPAAIIPSAAQAQTSVSDIEARLARQRALGAQKPVRREATRGIEEFRPSQLRARTDPADAAAAESGGASSVASTPAGQSSGVSVAAARPDAAPRVVEARDTSGQRVAVKVHDASMDISEPVRFAYNSAFLTAQARGVLDVYCAAIKSSEAKSGPAPGGYILIGHADASGDAEYNRVLSQKRAEESRRYMVEACGLPAAQLRAVGLGEEALKDPRNPNGAINRRVELQIGS